MKVLQIAPLWETVPPAAYGGTEAVVHLLVEELVKRHHQVTLWASGDSTTSACLESCYPASLRTADLENKLPYSWQHAALALKDARGYDIIHNHAGEEVMALSHLVPDVPMLTTMHCLITNDTYFVWERYEQHYNTISWAQRNSMPELHSGHFAGVAYNGIDVASYPFQERGDDHLLFISRFSEEKGPQVAIEVAKRTGKRLLLAGKVDPKDREFFQDVVEPLIDGEQVQFVGEADGRLKRDLYRQASCMIFPILWEEPFGLVMLEAMACGTPVVVFNRGAAPEIVEHGETGFVVDTIDEMVDAVRRVREIDPRYCRRHVERKFDASVMAERYLDIYETVLASRSAPALVPAGDFRREIGRFSPTQVA